MDFLNFAAAHGLLIDHLETGRIVRCKTSDHRHKNNGAYMFDGTWGFVQNWAVHDRPEIWITDKEVDQKELQLKLKKSREKYNQERARINQQAIKKAESMLRKCKNDTSVYLASKGFPDMCFNILHEQDKEPLLCVPMRINGSLSGLQVIAPDGAKRFVYGTNATYATFDIGNGGLHVYTEGLATALTAQLVMATLKIPYTIHCCFSAGNLKKVALKMGSGIILADHDESKTGENAAKDTGLKYFMSPLVGEDFNDYWLTNGTFKASMEIKKLIYK